MECQTQKLNNCSSNKTDDRAGGITVKAVTYAITRAATNVDHLNILIS